MEQSVAMFLLGLGVCLFVLGIALGGLSSLSSEAWAALTCGVGSVGVGVWLRRKTARWLRESRALRADQTSELAETLTPQLFGAYSDYVIEAAERLGAARDASAVPALMCVLERWVDAQRPGWREVSETLANALAQIGDRRALALLYRLENVRGIGFIPSIRGAIAAIEPQTSLLRPGSADFLIHETLLRPAQGRLANEEAAVLLRALPPD